MARTPSGFRNISTTYQLAYQTYEGNVQVRKIGDRLWEILPRGGAHIYETSKQAALKHAFKLEVGAVVTAEGAALMALTRTQKRWTIGGGFGVLALGIGYELFHRHGAAHQIQAQHERAHHKHARHEDDDGERENERGEYGQKHHHHHRRHDRD